jgi:hypothetical protein
MLRGRNRSDKPAAAGRDKTVDNVDPNALTNTEERRPGACEHMHFAPGPDPQGEPVGLAGLNKQGGQPVRGCGADRVVLRRALVICIERLGAGIGRIYDPENSCRFHASFIELLLIENLAGYDAVDRHVIDPQELPGWNHEAIADQHARPTLVRESADRGRKRCAGRRRASCYPATKPLICPRAAAAVRAR